MTEAGLPSLEQDAAILIEAVRQAGQIGLDYFNRDDVKVREKAKNDPVTEADLAIDAFLHKALMDARPGYGWLSEEAEDNRDRLQRKRCWIVDPIDGTRAFVNKKPQWCVATGLVENGHTVVGVVFNPVTDEFYHAIKDKGAFLNGKPLQTTGRQAVPGSTILTTASDLRKRMWSTHFSDVERVHVNSVAYKIALVAEGRYDAFFSIRGSNDWDIAGATLIAEEAGAVATDLLGAPCLYNQPRTRHGALVVAPQAMAIEIRQRLADMLSGEAKLPGNRPG